MNTEELKPKTIQDFKGTDETIPVTGKVWTIFLRDDNGPRGKLNVVALFGKGADPIFVDNMWHIFVNTEHIGSCEREDKIKSLTEFYLAKLYNRPVTRGEDI